MLLDIPRNLVFLPRTLAGSQLWPLTCSLIPERKQTGKTIFTLTTDKVRFMVINCLWVCWTAVWSGSLEASQKNTQCVWISSSGLIKSSIKLENVKRESHAGEVFYNVWRLHPCKPNTPDDQHMFCFGMGCCSDDSIPTRLHKAKNVVYSMLENSMLFPTR